MGRLDAADERRPELRRRAPARRARPTCARRPRWSSASPCRSAARRTAPPMSISVSATASRRAGGERVELHHVRPRREVRVAAPGEDAGRRCAGTPPDAARAPPPCRPAGTRAATPSTDGRARRGWGRSRGSARGRGRRARRARRRAPSRPAEALVDDVVAHAVGRADHVLGAQVGQRGAVGRVEPRVGRARSRARPGCARQTPISQTASTGSAAIASHSAPGTSSSSSGRPRSRPRRSSQTAVLIS